jgi:hypothetical protein
VTCVRVLQGARCQHAARFEAAEITVPMRTRHDAAADDRACRRAGLRRRSNRWHTQRPFLGLHSLGPKNGVPDFSLSFEGSLSESTGRWGGRAAHGP